MRLPPRITCAWMETLDDGNLLVAESRLHKTFFTLERAQKKLLGARYDLMRGDADLMLAWDRWSRVSTETRSRGLRPQRAPKS